MESRVPGVALLLALAVVLCSAQEPWTQTLNFDKGDDVFVHAAFHNVPVLQDGVTFAIEASDDSCKFVVCYSFLIRAPNDLTEWPRMCAMWVDWNKEIGVFKSQHVNPGINHLTLYRSNPSKCGAVVHLSGNACPEGGYGAGCFGLTDIAVIDELVLQPGSAVYFTAAPTNRWWTNEFNMTVHESAGRDFCLYMREGDAPRQANAELGEAAVFKYGGCYTGSGTLAVPNPRNLGHTSEDMFMMIFAIWNKGQQSIAVTAEPHENQCDRLQFGKGCKYSVPPLAGGIAYQMPNENKEWHYYSIIMTTGDQIQREDFSVGVTTLNGQEAPAMYLKYGSIPSSDDFDMKLGGYTNDTRYYFSGPTLARSARWFVGAHIARTVQKGAYGLWFNEECPNGCSEHGECNVETNECKCDEDYTQDWFTCGIQPKEGVTPVSPVYVEVTGSSSGGGGGTSGSEIFFIVMVSIESFVILVVIAAVVLFALRRYLPSARGAVDQNYDEL